MSAGGVVSRNVQQVSVMRMTSIWCRTLADDQQTLKRIQNDIREQPAFADGQTAQQEQGYTTAGEDVGVPSASALGAWGLPEDVLRTLQPSVGHNVSNRYQPIQANILICKAYRGGRTDLALLAVRFDAFASVPASFCESSGFECELVESLLRWHAATLLLSSLLIIMLLCLDLTGILAVCKFDSREHFFNSLSHTTILLSRRFWWGSQLLQRFVGVSTRSIRKGCLTSRVCLRNCHGSFFQRSIAGQQVCLSVIHIAVFTKHSKLLEIVDLEYYGHASF